MRWCNTTCSNIDDNLNITNKEISLLDSPSPIPSQIPSPVSTDSTSCQDFKDNHDNDNSRKVEDKIENNENKQESDKNNKTKDIKLSKEDKILNADLRIKYLRKYQFMSYDLETKLLYWKLCRDFSKDNVPRFGKQYIEDKHISQHAIINYHKDAFGLDEEKGKKIDPIEIIFNMNRTMITDNDLVPLFRNIYFLAKQNIALHKAETLHALNHLNGVQMNLHYSNHVKAKEIMSYILQNILKKAND